ncbi:hypothetical protein [Streptomyces boninensis]|uniref:hypothetical protein n=1 Tax=Streptomyces boninensis TaxID=2039455 RepID=UPI003B21E705
MSAERMRVGRWLAAAVLVLLPVVCAPGAYADAPAPAPAAERAAKALRESPVSIDPSLADAVPEARQRRLARQIKKTKLPIKVAIAPLVLGDAYDGDSEKFAEDVRRRLGGGDLIVVTLDGMDVWLRAYEWPEDWQQAEDAAGAVGHLERMREAGLADRLDKAVELIEEGDGRRVYERATADLGDDDEPVGGSDAKESGLAPWFYGGGIGAGAVLLLGGAGLLTVRRRGGLAAHAASPFAFPRQVFAAAREADEAELRRYAEAEVIALGEAVQAADGTKARAAALTRALDAYAAAGTVLDGARDLADLAGVLALVAEGRDALREATAPGHPRPGLPLCFFHPLHGRAVRRLGWRPLGRREELAVAACAACAAAVAEKVPPEVLTVRRDDGPVPYFELPKDRSLWAATGYGSLAEESLAARVGRGDFTRAAKRT